MMLPTVRLAMAGLAVVFVSACVSTTIPRPLTAEQVASLRIERVNVTVPPDASIAWAGGELEYAESKGLTQPVGTRVEREDYASSGQDYAQKFATLVKTDEARQFVRSRAGAILQEEIQTAMTGRLAGRQPVRLEVTLRRLTVQNPLLRILADNHDELVADISVVDAATGRPMATYASLTASQQNTGGIAGAFIQTAMRGDAHRQLSKVYASRFQAWLLQN